MYTMTDSRHCAAETNTTSKSSYPPIKKKLAYLDLSLEYHYPLVLTLFLLISGPESAEFLSWRLWNLRGKRYHFYSQKLPFEEAGITQ